MDTSHKLKSKDILNPLVQIIKIKQPKKIFGMANKKKPGKTSRSAI